MALITFKCNCLIPLHFKGLISLLSAGHRSLFSVIDNCMVYMKTMNLLVIVERVKAYFPQYTVCQKNDTDLAR